MIGIDLGNEHSVVAFIGLNGPATALDSDGSYLIPSVIAADSSGKILYGRAAQRYLRDHPDRGQAQFVNDLGKNIHYEFGGRKWTPADCLKQLFFYLKQIATDNLGKTPSACVIAVPAYYHDGQRSSVKEAATANALPVFRLMNEPTAVALRFWFDDASQLKHLLVLDFGEQKFDVTVLRVNDSGYEVLATHGITPCPYADAELNTLTYGMKKSIDTALSDAQLKIDKIDDILLVGTTAHINKFNPVFDDKFSWICKTSKQADQAVAQGAAIYATMSLIQAPVPTANDESKGSGCAGLFLLGISSLAILTLAVLLVHE